MRYAHTNIIAKDWQKLVDFYIAVFECELKPPVRNQSGDWLASGTGVANASLEGAHLLLPGHGENGPTLEIYQYAEIHDQPALMPNRMQRASIRYGRSKLLDAYFFAARLPATIILLLPLIGIFGLISNSR